MNQKIELRKCIESSENESFRWEYMNILCNNGVPFVSYAFWFGGSMKGNRRHSYEQLKSNIGTPFLLFTENNISKLEVKGHPFHPAVKYTLKYKKGLSGNHLSDYFRIYMSYHFGGAYHDIKSRLDTQSIEESWRYFINSNIWVVGMAEIGWVAGDSDVKEYILQQEKTGKNDLIVSPDGKWDDQNLKETNLISNGAWIARPKTDLFKKVNSFAEKRLTGWYQEIKRYPVLNFKRCCLRNETYGYPVHWTGLQGSIFHPYQAVYRSHIIRDLPWYDLQGTFHYSDKSERVVI